MTVKITREILGKKVAHLTDKEIKELNIRTSILCDDILDLIIKEQNTSSVKLYKLTKDEKHGKKESK